MNKTKVWLYKKESDIREKGMYDIFQYNFMLRMLFFFIFLLSIGCSKDDDCTKTTIIPDHMIGNAFYPEQRLAVPCDFLNLNQLDSYPQSSNKTSKIE